MSGDVNTSSNTARSRYNAIGVQQLSTSLYPQIFKVPKSPPTTLVELSKQHLAQHQLLGKNQDASPPIGLDLPPLHGQTLDEHFYRLGRTASEPWLQYASALATADLPPAPKRWKRQSGWVKYYLDGRSEAVPAPEEEMLTFDVEVMWKVSSFPVMACAASPVAWYAWLSPWLLGESETDRHLIPLGESQKSRVVVGHNIGYDRARVLEEYDVKQTRNFYLDTMSLHVAVNGMCSRQRPTWMKHMKNRDLRDRIQNETDSAELATLLENNVLSEEEEELWVGRSSVNSLRDVAKFHCDVTLDKSQRDDFGTLDRALLLERYDSLLGYCASDVAITHKVYKKVFPGFKEVCPHPVSFAALRHLSAAILPVDESWNAYLANADATYHRLTGDIEQRLSDLAKKTLESKDDPSKYENDPWMQQIDWSGQEIKMVKGKKKNDPPRPAARQKMPGMPKWYKDLFVKSTADINLTVRTRITPQLLRLTFDGYPLAWSDKYGWTYKVPNAEIVDFEGKAVILCDMSDEKNARLRDDTEHQYLKLPHKDGPTARCVSPMAKGYLQYFENGRLSSEYDYAKEALEMNASCSYWVSARDRIMSQMVVYDKDIKKTSTKRGYIIPQVIPMGTITRRAVENTWLTASNAKKNRVGSELKSMIRAPPGYHFVGADVDSEELWIASLVGDAKFQLHGGNALGFMTLEGTKTAGTDLHSSTARILGISRNDAKVFNYGRIYGAGLKFAATLLRQFNPNLSEKETEQIAAKLYKETKGAKTARRALSRHSFWRGGTESFVFNTLEEFAESEQPRTPALGAGITEALMRRFINKGAFMTSRINWAIQSSGVDYLHLLIVSMDYLIARYAIDARLAITVHDEIRYLVRSGDRYRAAMALQVANLWTRALFAQQVGIEDLPQSCAFFSAIDIDHVLRKEVDMDCITPSHPNPISPGESLDMWSLLAKESDAALDPAITPAHSLDPDQWEYTPRRRVMADVTNDAPTPRDLALIRAQITSSDSELRDIIRELGKETLLPIEKSRRTLNTKATKTAKPREPSVTPSPSEILDGIPIRTRTMPQRKGVLKDYPQWEIGGVSQKWREEPESAQ